MGSIIGGIAGFAKRIDNSVTVQVPARNGRKAYSYTRGGSKSEGGILADKESSQKRPLNVNKKGSVLALGAISALVAGNAIHASKQISGHKKSLEQAYKDHKRNVEDLKGAYEAKRGGSKETQEDEAHTALGLEKGASQEEIRKAHREIIRKHHPDRDKSAEGQEKVKKANAAVDMLDDRKRAARESAKRDRVERKNSISQRIDSFIEVLRQDSTTTVQVPARNGRKAYSYTKEGGNSSGKSPKKTEGITAPIKRTAPALAAYAALAVLSSKVRKKAFSDRESTVKDYYAAHEENIKRQNGITDEDIQKAKESKNSQAKAKPRKQVLDRLALNAGR